MTVTLFIVEWPKTICLWASCLIGFVSVCYAILFCSWDINRLLEFHKCPACYGESLCPLLQNNPGSLKVYYFGYFGWIINTVMTKNVYRGSLNSTEVIIKRLGHESELRDMDKIMCDKVPTLCQKKSSLSDSIYSYVMKDTENLLSSQLLHEKKMNLLRLCPSFQNMPLLFQNVDCHNCENWPLSMKRLANIWTMLHINAEPLILQIFPRERDWPFPRYLGACGRMIVETYEGNSLLYSYHDSWKNRAWFALQLLEAVDQFTLRSPDFALYLLDYSVDNIAVDLNNHVTFVDLEHSIVVDKHSSPPESRESWDSLHQSGALCDNNGDCSYYSPDDVCEHKISDFNHYMLCKEILAPSDDVNVAMSEGLLHTTPQYILQKYPVFESALKNCSSDANLNHMAAAQLVRDFLRAELSSYPHRGGECP